MLRWVPFGVFLHFLLMFWWVFSLWKWLQISLSVKLARQLCVCVHPLNKDVSQAVIGTFFSVPFSKDGRMGRFWGFSLLYVEVYQINVSFLSYCDYCSTCEKSFLTGKECLRECTHCRSPHQKKYIYIYIERERERERERGYYMAARRCKISLRVLKNISRVSAANEWNIFFNTGREISYLQATM